MEKKRGAGGAMKFAKEGAGGRQTEKKEGAGGSNFRGGVFPPCTFFNGIALICLFKKSFRTRRKHALHLPRRVPDPRHPRPNPPRLIPHPRRTIIKLELQNKRKLASHRILKGLRFHFFLNHKMRIHAVEHLLCGQLWAMRKVFRVVRCPHQ